MNLSQVEIKSIRVAVFIIKFIYFNITNLWYNILYINVLSNTNDNM